MRTFFVFALVLFCDWTAAAATLEVEVNRHGLTGPIRVAVAPRIDGKRPEWSTTKTLAADQSSVSFDELTTGLYVVLASGPQPLQRLSAKVNLGSDGTTLHLALPRSKAALSATLGGKPLARARIVLTHQELRWETAVDTGDDGTFAGELWEPGAYTASVSPDPAFASYNARISLAPKALTLDVPDRHVTGRVLVSGKPLAGAIVDLRSESSESTKTVRMLTGADGRFSFPGVREGALTLTARAPSYLDSDAVVFDLRGSPAQHTVDIELARGESRAVRVIGADDTPIAGATLIASCGGHVKSTAITKADGRTDVALPAGASCAIFVLPKDGSFAVTSAEGSEPLLIHVAKGSSSLRLALQTVAGEPFPEMNLLLRIDGIAVPPATARFISSLGFSLATNEQGSLALEHIPPGTYDFWPYRTTAEGQMLYETATEFPAPISLTVLEGENNAMVKFKAR